MMMMISLQRDDSDSDIARVGSVSSVGGSWCGDTTSHTHLRLELVNYYRNNNRRFYISTLHTLPAACERGAGRVANNTSFQSIIPSQNIIQNFTLIIYVEILNATLYICCFMFFLLPVTLNISIAKWTAVLINRYIYNYKHKLQPLYIHYYSTAKKVLQYISFIKKETFYQTLWKQVFGAHSLSHFNLLLSWELQ